MAKVPKMLPDSRLLKANAASRNTKLGATGIDTGQLIARLCFSVQFALRNRPRNSALAARRGQDARLRPPRLARDQPANGRHPAGLRTRLEHHVERRLGGTAEAGKSAGCHDLT